MEVPCGATTLVKPFVKAAYGSAGPSHIMKPPDSSKNGLLSPFKVEEHAGLVKEGRAGRINILGQFE
jgi:hypothetical protein